MSHPSHSNPQVTGSWRPVDGTQHTLERADTAQKGMIAVRSNENPGDILFTTPGQIHKLDQAEGSGKLPR